MCQNGNCIWYNGKTWRLQLKLTNCYRVSYVSQWNNHRISEKYNRSSIPTLHKLIGNSASSWLTEGNHYYTRRHDELLQLWHHTIICATIKHLYHTLHKLICYERIGVRQQYKPPLQDQLILYKDSVFKYSLNGILYPL